MNEPIQSANAVNPLVVTDSAEERQKQIEWCLKEQRAAKLWLADAVMEETLIRLQFTDALALPSVVSDGQTVDGVRANEES